MIGIPRVALLAGPAIAVVLAQSSASAPEDPTVGTFSIVAADPRSGEIGVAVQSRIVGVGAVVPWARAGVGAVATQALANVAYGADGLALLEKGESPGRVVAALVEADAGREKRQVGVVSAAGEAANFTGSQCLEWAGGRTGRGYCVQGNILAGEAVVAAMAGAFERTEGELSERLLAALEAGQEAGGDLRGKQSAALLVVREGWGYGGGNDRFRDIRVDDHPDPIAELRRVYRKHCELFPRPVDREGGGESR